MRQLTYRLLNVFAVPGARLSGNPLCVFEDGSSLGDREMQALARQFNLSETTFVLPATEGADARVRIFTPTFEMPFAGHPTLGTAQVVRALRGGEALTLQMGVGPVKVVADRTRWTLRVARPVAVREPQASAAELAAMLGLPVEAVLQAKWIDTRVEQLLIQLASSAEVRAVAPNPQLLAHYGKNSGKREGMAYVWSAVGDGEILARGTSFFRTVRSRRTLPPARPARISVATSSRAVPKESGASRRGSKPAGRRFWVCASKRTEPSSSLARWWSSVEAPSRFDPTT